MNSAILPLFVAVPLVSAGATVLLRGPIVQRIALLLVSSVTLIGGVALLVFHQQTPALAHSIGSYKQKMGIVFVSDTLSALLLVVTAFLTMISGIFLMLTKEDRYRFVVPLIVLLNTGVNGALLTGDLFNLFVWVEVMLLPSYALIAVTGSWRRLGIGRMFVIVNIVTSTILVMGVGLLYGAIGSVNLAALAGKGGDPPGLAGHLDHPVRAPGQGWRGSRPRLAAPRLSRDLRRDHVLVRRDSHKGRHLRCLPDLCHHLRRACPMASGADGRGGDDDRRWCFLDFW